MTQLITNYKSKQIMRGTQSVKILAMHNIFLSIKHVASYIQDI